jgi:tetratricopeptide (TPR) repeat protein
MSSIIEGYNYDIFISYRQKDNKHDGWVTEFVENLKGELESTFKEEISVYFDINPHDGLLETHDVDASLKDKLKCLVFIPIISRTYCDPKSFAWEHEFKAFVEQASNDKFGLKVKLPNGNVANRVLPVRIHDLDPEDIKLCESVLGGVLRGVEFIYKEPGVNKPLTSDDDEKKNLSNTKYRIQINKVANAIKEIISGLKAEPALIAKENTTTEKYPLKDIEKEKVEEALKNPDKSKLVKLLSGIVILVILIVAGLFAYPRIFKGSKMDLLRPYFERTSIVVLPFQNMTNDTTWNIWQTGIQDMLITSLSNSGDLIVRQTESVNGLIQSKKNSGYTSITSSDAGKISRKLGADIFIYGNIKRAGDIIRVNAQLVDSKTEVVSKSFQIEGPSGEKNIFRIIDSLSVEVINFLVVSKLKRLETYESQKFNYTNSPEAFRLFLLSEIAFFKRDYSTAISMGSQAMAIDSNFIFPAVYLSLAYEELGLYEQAKKMCLKAYKKKDKLPIHQQLYIDWVYALNFETPHEEIKHLKQLLEIDDQIPIAYFSLGYAYMCLNQYDKAIPEYEKSLDIYNRWNIKPTWVYNYTNLGYSYHETGNYKLEKKIYKKAELDFPDDPQIIFHQAILALTEKDTVMANEYIKKYIAIVRDQSTPEARIINRVAFIYSQANIPDKAEEYYRRALSLNPLDMERINSLAYFLIDKDRDINEGLNLIEKALSLSPDNYEYLDTQGWGLYKQGKFKEALETLQKSWDLRLRNAIYDQDAFLHLDAARKAIANQKKN